MGALSIRSGSCRETESQMAVTLQAAAATALRQPADFGILARSSVQLRSSPSVYKSFGLELGSARLSCCSPQEDAEVVSQKLPEEPGSTNDDVRQAAGSSSPDPGFPEYPSKDINKRVAIFSTLAAAGLFLSTRLDLGVSLKDLSAAALPYEQAISNGKPTVVEFYADWCEVCRELAPDVYKVEQQYKDRVNFVMLNVDNTKWEQELDEFGVEGIPHFAFLDKEGNEEGNVVGRLPRQIFLENVDALARGEASIPHSRVVGQFSTAEARKVKPIADPRSHG